MNHTPCSSSLNLSGILLFVITLISAGCSQIPDQTVQAVADPKQSFEQNQRRLSTLSEWKIKGSVAIKTVEESHTANLNWRYEKAQYDLKLTSFIGTSLLDLKGDEQQATLILDGETYRSRTPERLIYQTTGWRLPVSTLPDWILGRLSDRSSSHLFDDLGRLSAQTQQTDDGMEWRVDYLQFQRNQDLWLPRKLTLHGPNITIKLVVSKWELIQ